MVVNNVIEIHILIRTIKCILFFNCYIYIYLCVFSVLLLLQHVNFLCLREVYFPLI